METSFFYFHLMGLFVGETLDQLRMGGKAVDWLRITWVTHSRCSCEVTDEGGSHNDQLAYAPGMEGVTTFQVGGPSPCLSILRHPALPVSSEHGWLNHPC
jgi:hypothetical protein